jgi:hypothetical protein
VSCFRQQKLDTPGKPSAEGPKVWPKNWDIPQNDLPQAAEIHHGQEGQESSEEEARKYPQFQAGDTVRTQRGQIRTVLMQRGCQVFVVEESSSW